VAGQFKFREQLHECIYPVPVCIVREEARLLLRPWGKGGREGATWRTGTRALKVEFVCRIGAVRTKVNRMRRMKQVEARRRRSATAPALTTRQRDALLTAQRLLAGTHRIYNGLFTDHRLRPNFVYCGEFLCRASGLILSDLREGENCVL